MRPPNPLDVLDRNVCAGCGGAVVLLYRVGWVHQVYLPADLVLPPRFTGCEKPAPHRLRCPSCRQLAECWGSRMRPHYRGRGVPCPGSGQVGTLPLAEEVAFPAAPTGET